MANTDLKLPPALEQFVAAQVEKGAYRSRRAAIIAAVSNEMRRSKQRTRLGIQLQNGLESGPPSALDVEAVIQRGRSRQAARVRRRRG